MRGPLVTRRVLVPVVAGVLMLLVGWTIAAPVSAEGSASGRVPAQRTTTTVAPPTTTTTAVPATSEPPVPTVANETKTVETKGEIDDPAQKELRWIIFGLIGLAVVILILTIWFWRATRPSRVQRSQAVVASPTSDGATADGAPSTGAATSAPSVRPMPMPTDSVRISTRGPAVPPGHRAPIWADEHVAAGTAKVRATAKPSGTDTSPAATEPPTRGPETEG